MNAVAEHFNLDALVDTLAVMVPFRMAEIDRLARVRVDHAVDPAPDEYDRQVRILADRIDPRYAHTRLYGSDITGLVNRLTGAPIASTNAAIVATQGDAMYGDSKEGAAETVVVALATLIAAAALIQPGGVTFHGTHWVAA